jgi:hypothetical protein
MLFEPGRALQTILVSRIHFNFLAASRLEVWNFTRRNFLSFPVLNIQTYQRFMFDAGLQKGEK